MEFTDGDQFELRIAPVAKKLGDATVRMLAYNSSVPGRAELSGVRRREGELVATIWNATGERRQAGVGHETLELPPAAIATVAL